MNINYIIVQAGGKGVRMGSLTRNKPKALVPVGNLPMLFHLFRKYPTSKFVVIGDYLYDVLERYLQAFAPVEYHLVRAFSEGGTCSGLNEALEYVPVGEPFLLIWSDLILPEGFTFPETDGDYVGVAKDFPCRWKYECGEFIEEQSDSSGVAGLFVFREKAMLANVPDRGEFVRWLSSQNFELDELPLYHTKEYGLKSEYDKLGVSRCRPFNRIVIRDDTFVKEPVDSQGRELARREATWYRKVIDKGFGEIPKIYDLEPICMELIDGKNIYEYTELSHADKRCILERVITCLKQVQEVGSVPSDRDSYEEAYIGKTMKRLQKVQALVPFANDPVVMVNGKRCRNVFFHEDELREKIAVFCPEKFKLIHGDCTFSNIMLRSGGAPVLIDPRGYFGTTELYGDPAYDWVKLYYSVVGNYDQFNLKRFSLHINEKDVELSIGSNHWEDMEGDFFQLLEGEVTQEQIRLFHAIIWLSLTTYAWEDYDSICGAFYNGLYYLEESL